jgi:RNA polymerase sigma factor (sigma-70 family)
MQELIESILPFIRAKCRKYAISEGQNVEDSESYSDALLFAVQAAKRFDETLGISFLGYCGHLLVKELKQGFLRRNRHLIFRKKVHWIGEIDVPEALRDSVDSAEIAALRESISTLQEEQRLILCSGRSFRELAKELGVSYEMVSRRRKAALEQLRERLEALGFGE